MLYFTALPILTSYYFRGAPTSVAWKALGYLTEHADPGPTHSASESVGLGGSPELTGLISTQINTVSHGLDQTWRTWMLLVRWALNQREESFLLSSQTIWASIVCVCSSWLSFLGCLEHSMILKHGRKPEIFPLGHKPSPLQTPSSHFSCFSGLRGWHVDICKIVMSGFFQLITESYAMKTAHWNSAVEFHLLLRTLMRRDRQLLLFISLISQIIIHFETIQDWKSVHFVPFV